MSLNEIWFKYSFFTNETILLILSLFSINLDDNFLFFNVSETTLFIFDKEFEEIDGEQRSVQSVIDEILNWLRTRYYPKKSETISIENYPGTEEERQRFLKDLNEWCDEKQHILDLFAKIISHLNW